MSVKRRDLVRYLEQNGFSLLREGGKHSILLKWSEDSSSQASSYARSSNGKRDMQTSWIATAFLAPARHISILSVLML